MTPQGLTLNIETARLETSVAQNMSTNSTAEQLVDFFPVVENGRQSQIAQLQHRLELIATWGGIAPGTRILELGCGQGDCTVALAHSVGANGSVDAIDPAPPGYESPWTVEESQQHISSTSIGDRISWIKGEPLKVLSAESEYDIGVLAHCLWYFSSPSAIKDTFERLGSQCKRIYIAEWSLSSSVPSALPHVLSALAQASLECCKPQSDSNVRTVVSPTAIKQLAEEAGLKVVQEGIVTPGEGIHDGRWEVLAVASKGFVEEVKENVKDEREQSVVFSLRDAMLSSLEGVENGKKGVRSMDVWCGVFEKA